MENDTTKQEILEAMNEFSTRVDENFKKIDERFEKIENTMSGMVTKTYLEDKLNEKFGGLRADLVILTRKEDNKLGATVSLLGEKHVFTGEETKNILAMEPFPKVSV